MLPKLKEEVYLNLSEKLSYFEKSFEELMTDVVGM
jgi:hypothetical protein